MTIAPPISCEWTGEHFSPSRHHKPICDKAFVVGERYTLVEHQARSQATHNHYFAELAEAWANLPDDQAERFPTAEHLRKFALIKCGFANRRDFVASSKAEALRFAAFIRAGADYEIVTVSASVVTVWTAQSQSMRAMGKAAFQDSKTKVLDYVASLIGVTAGDLRRQAGRAA